MFINKIFILLSRHPKHTDSRQGLRLYSVQRPEEAELNP